MRLLRVPALLIGLACAAVPLRGQAVDRDLPDRPLELHLWRADVSIVLQAGATPHITAWAVRGQDAVELEGPAVRFDEQDNVLRVSRAVESQDVTVHVEATLDLGHPLRLIGREVSVAIQGPPLDIGEIEMLRDLAQEEQRELPTPAWSDLSLTLADSQADVFGVSGAWLEGRNSYFVIRQSTNELRVELDGGGVDVDQHRGVLGLSGTGEFAARNAVGTFELAVDGGDVELVGAEGRVSGTVADTALHFIDWRGQVQIESRGGAVEMRAFRPAWQQMIEITADGTEVVIEGLEMGTVDLEQKGGKLVLRDITGKMRIEARLEAELEMQRLGGTWTALLQNSALHAEEVERLALELYDSKLEVAGVEGLEIHSHGSEIAASGVGRLGRTSLARSTASLELAEGAGGELAIQNGTQVTVRMSAPCIVSVEGEIDTQAGASLDVTGCREGLGPEGLEGDGAGGPDRPAHLRVSVAGASGMEVRGRL